MADHPDKGQQAPISCLSILIPVYNEVRTLEVLLRRVMAAPLPCAREVVVVDDGSTDGSAAVLDRLAREYPEITLLRNEQNAGKGAAIRRAIDAMRGDWAIIQDADLEYAPEDYQVMLAPVLEGLADAVFGSRFEMGRYRRAMYFWHTAANKALTLLCNIFADLNITDMETCYKLVRADILKSLNLRSQGFDLEPELTIKLARWGARIYEAPISYSGRTYAEGKKIGAKDALRAFFALFRYRFFDPHYVKYEGFLVLQAIQRARGFNRWMFAQIQPWLGDEVLEAGSGIGTLTGFVLDRPRLVCLDNDPFYVDRLEKNYGQLANFRIYQADLEKEADLLRAAEDGPFDAIFCLNVVEHIEDDAALLKRFFRLLKPGGRLIVLVPHNPALYSKLDKVLGHYRRYTPEILTRRFEAAGFSVRRCQGFNRVGALGWRISAKWLGRAHISHGQMRLFECCLPLIKLAEALPFHSHNSLIAVGERPEETAEEKE